MKNKFIKLGVVMLGLTFWVPGALAAAFGISPPWIINENLKPGSSFVYLIDLSATGLEEDMVIHATFDGASEISDWVTVQNMNGLTMQKGDNKLPLSVNVRIPVDAPLGHYQGNLKLVLAHRNGVDDVSVLLGGKVEIDLTVVGNDVTDYYIQSVRAEPVYEGQEVILDINAKNLGNTVLKNINTRATLTEISSNRQMGSFEANQLSTPIYPQTMANTKITLDPPGVGPGNYWLDVEAQNGGKVMYKNRLYFTVNRSAVNNSLGTAVYVGDGTPGTELKMMDNDMKSSATDVFGSKSKLKTSVTVRAPIAEELIIVVIGILLILTGIVGKFYFTFKKKRR